MRDRGHSRYQSTGTELSTWVIQNNQPAWCPVWPNATVGGRGNEEAGEKDDEDDRSLDGKGKANADLDSPIPRACALSSGVRPPAPEADPTLGAALSRLTGTSHVPRDNPRNESPSPSDYPDRNCTAALHPHACFCLRLRSGDTADLER